MKIGIGYDFHRLVKNRKLVIGGVEIPNDKGLLGHSDGDVLLHAICDAILGASGERDIGVLFPDTDPKFKDISSLILIADVMRITHAKIINIDSVIICESPRLAGYIPRMQEKIAQIVGVGSSCISIKAKTNEGVGSVGKGEGISAYAVVLIE